MINSQACKPFPMELQLVFNRGRINIIPDCERMD